MKVSVYIATSLDGFIARKDGSLDWLPGSDPAAEPGADSEIHAAEWAAFWGSVDALILGRKTFEQVLDFGVWPYEGTRVIVLSGTMASLPEEMAGKAEIFSGDVRALLARLSAEGHKRLYIDGGQTIQRFLRLGLVTDMTIATVPVLIGEGIALFGSIPADIALEHVRTITLPSGMVQSTYEVSGRSDVDREDVTPR